MATKKVVVFGASGNTGKYITRKLMAEENVELSVFVRNPAKLADIDTANINVIKGDALNAEDVKNAMAGQDILVCSLEGDVLSMANNIVAALEGSGVSRIIWITGMGIHGEITGVAGFMLKQLAKKRPEYIKAADTIFASGVDATLLRCGGIKNGNNETYDLTKEGVQPRGDRSVERAAIAACIADMIKNEELGKNESIAITN